MVDLKDKHSFALTAFAHHVQRVQSKADIAAIEWHQDAFILGAGSNTVFTHDFCGHLIINQLQGFTVERKDAYYQVTIGAGEDWHQCVERLLEQGIFGLENLALIPGSVGAAPVQNIGAYGVEVAQFIACVRGVDLRSQTAFELSQDACQFGYRTSIFKQPDYASWLITEVVFHLPFSWRPHLGYPDLAHLTEDVSAREVFDTVVEVRKRKLPDPKVLPNAGSFFKNPVISATQCRKLRQRYPDLRYFELPNGDCKLAAAWLIDQAGLKSLRVGGAGVHQRQALVLVNSNQATGQDLIQLAQQVRKQVEQRFNVRLEPEVLLLGERGHIEL